MNIKIKKKRQIQDKLISECEKKQKEELQI